MSGQPKHELLTRNIATALESSYNRGSSSRALLITGIALACFQPSQADALTLGTLQVESTIGQPLVSTTTARIGTGESLSAGCVTSVANPQGGLNLPSDLIVTVPETSASGVHPVRITSAKPLYEPMYEIRLQVNCTGSVSLVRNYVVILNMPMSSLQTQPAGNTLQPVLQANQQPNTQNRVSTAEKPVPPAPTQTSRAPDLTTSNTPIVDAATANTATEANLRPYTERFPTPQEPITADAEYRIQPGDGLSTIAHRIQGRPDNTTWEVAAQLHQLNPDAFVGNNPNLIKLGSVITIPPVDELLGQEMVAMRPNPEIIAVKQVTTPALEQVIDLPQESITKNPTNEIIAEQSTAAVAAQPEFVKESAPVTAPTEAANQAIEVETELAAPAEIPELISSDTNPDETEILVDRSLLENLPEQETIAPIDAAEVSKLEAYEPASAITQSEDEPVAEETTFSISPILATGLGALLAFAIALLMFGKRIRAKVFPDHTAKRNAQAIDASDLSDDLNATLNQEQPGFSDDGFSDDNEAISAVEEIDFTDTKVVAEAEDTDAAEEQPEEATPELIAAATPEDIGTGSDTGVDLDISATSASAVDSLDLDLTGQEVDDKQHTATHIDLLGDDAVTEKEAPLEKTERFTGPDFSTDGMELDSAPSELDGTGTMRKLFSEEADKRKAEAAQDSGGFEVTQKMPELDDQVSLDAASDLQSLADNVDVNNPNDLSATLSQALGLLEQDYEEEHSESQIMEQREIETAFSEHAKND